MRTLEALALFPTASLALEALLPPPFGRSGDEGSEEEAFAEFDPDALEVPSSGWYEEDRLFTTMRNQLPYA